MKAMHKRILTVAATAALLAAGMSFMRYIDTTHYPSGWGESIELPQDQRRADVRPSTSPIVAPAQSVPTKKGNLNKEN